MPNSRDKEVCPSCGAITSHYTFVFGYLDARLLLEMAKIVRSRSGSMSFTDANKVHLTTELNDSVLINRSTIASKLGLIAKFIYKGHQESGMWVITARGWAALRGEEVPARVSVFRRQITERYDEKITMTIALKSYPDSSYNPVEWYEFLKKGE